MVDDQLFAGLQRQLLGSLDMDTLELPSLPEVALQVGYLARDPKSSLREIADAITADPAMASQILRLAQTLRYSRPGMPINSLPVAIARIGLQGTVNVAMALSIRQLFSFHATQIRQLCRHMQHKAVHISRFALTLMDEYVPEQVEDNADFLVLAAVLLDVGSLPLLAELDFQIRQNQVLPENPQLLDWCEQIRVPLGQRLLQHWQLDASFLDLLPLTIRQADRWPRRMLALAEQYYRYLQQHQQTLDDLEFEFALQLLPIGDQRQQLCEWAKRYLF